MMQKIDDIINFAGSTFERLPPQSYSIALFVLWCGLGIVGALSWKRLVRLQRQLDQLRRDLRHLELEESRRIISELLKSSSS